MPTQADQDQAVASFRTLMVAREGDRTRVYADSRGLPSVGIGHLVVQADNLVLGDIISEVQVEDFFTADSAGALQAAWDQAALAGITSIGFIPYLASVNFQLGTNWTQKFPNTWKMIVDGDYRQAASALDGTLWQHQTPVRVQDFQGALRVLPPKP